MDACGDRPITWVHAPAGSGKTVLVASYLQSRKIKPIWYKTDAGDAEPASFFHYLADAARATSGKNFDLPPLTGEYAAGKEIFARNYFSSMLGYFKDPVLVFDDYQNLPEDALTQEILAGALSELPKGCRAIIVSRSEPPGPFARLQASQSMGFVNPDELLFNEEEVGELLKLMGIKPSSTGSVEELYRKTRGWVAGCVLMMETSRLSGTAVKDVAAEPPRVMFEYFSREVFRLLDEETRDVLLRTAFMPGVTPAWAESLTNNPNAPSRLEQLAQRNYFTLRRSTPSLVYEFHPLFSDFLRQYGLSNLEAETVAGIKRQSAHLLGVDGQTDSAVVLWREIEDWDRIETAVLDNAEDLLAAGRNDTLQAWIRYLPDRHRTEHPYIRLWNGLAYLPMKPIEAQAELAEAWRQFRDVEDKEGALMAWAGIADSFVFRQDYSELRDWIIALEELLAAHPDFPSKQVEARVAASMVKHLWLAWVDHPYREKWEQRAEQLAELLNPNLRVQFQAYFVASLAWTGRLAQAKVHVDEMRALLSTSDLLPLIRLTAHVADSLYCWFASDWETALKTVIAGLDISEQSGVRVFDAQLYGNGAATFLALGDVTAASEYLDKMLPLIQPGQYQDYSYYHVLAMWHALTAGEYLRAKEHQRRAHAATIDGGLTLPEVAAFIPSALIDCELGNLQAAKDALKWSLQKSQEYPCPTTELMCHLTVAEWALDSGDQPAALDSMKRALGLVRELNISVCMGCCRPNLARLLTFALERKIEAKTIRLLIDRLQLQPPENEIPHQDWPLPIRIKVLGGFSLEHRGKQLEFSGKAKRKPIDLLKALIAFGGNQVQERELADALWPDSEGDASSQALATTLHRLRKAVGDDDFIQRQSGALTLRRSSCWIDLWELEALLERPDEHGVAERILALYRPLLGQEDTVWVLGPREKLQRRVLNVLRAWADERLTSENYLQAMPIYEGILEIDSIAEDCCRGLMKCLAGVGRNSEMIVCFNRCRDALLATLGREPSEETTTLYRKLQDDESSSSHISG
jgi:ATP/maltotriose-dependent transcriptional regulator MalT/DNA-binding SARP family transcriptional activator